MAVAVAMVAIAATFSAPAYADPPSGSRTWPRPRLEVLDIGIAGVLVGAASVGAAIFVHTREKPGSGVGLLSGALGSFGLLAMVVGGTCIYVAVTWSPPSSSVTKLEPRPPGGVELTFSF